MGGCLWHSLALWSFSLRVAQWLVFPISSWVAWSIAGYIHLGLYCFWLGWFSIFLAIPLVWATNDRIYPSAACGLTWVNVVLLQISLLVEHCALCDLWPSLGSCNNGLLKLKWGLHAQQRHNVRICSRSEIKAWRVGKVVMGQLCWAETGRDNWTFFFEVWLSMTPLLQSWLAPT